MPLNINQYFLNKSSLISGKQAQQTHRFVLRVKGVDSALITGVSSPKYKMTSEKFTMLGYDFNYPAKIEWQNPITFDVIQILDDTTITSTLGYFMSKLYNSAYYASPLGIGDGEKDILLPDSLYNARDKTAAFLNNGPNTGYARKSGEGSILDLSKQKLTAALGIVEINTLDEEGKIFESWRLRGAYISGITPTDLAYENEKLSTVKVELTYDWADYGFRGVFAEEDAVVRIFSI